jgi:hypothetical protein
MGARLGIRGVKTPGHFEIFGLILFQKSFFNQTTVI